jgi:hypothetical protein
MKTNYIQQEVLLITGTTFMSGKLCEKDESGANGRLTEQESLEEACWNGLLPMILPEICLQQAGGRNLTLWQVKEASSFLELDLGETPDAIDKQFSIKPYSFLVEQSYN